MKNAYFFFLSVMIVMALILGAIGYNKDSVQVSKVFTPVAMEAVTSEEKTDITPLLSKADREYLAGNKSKSVNELQEAIDYIRSRQSEELNELLPKQVEGWSVRTQTLNSDSVSEEKIPSGQAIASQEFVNDDRLIKISIIIGSELNEQIYELATMSNGSGGVGDYKGYVKKFYRTPQSNSLVIGVGKETIVSIGGFNLSHSDALQIADSINLAKILEYVNK